MSHFVAEMRPVMAASRVSTKRTRAGRKHPSWRRNPYALLEPGTVSGVGNSMNRQMSLAAFLFAGALGCGSSTSSSTVSAIGLSPDPCAVRQTDSTQMSAEATLPDGTKTDITSADGVEWSSGNTSVLTVSPKGVVVGVNPGVTSVAVTYQGARGTIDCTVTP